MRKGFIFSLSAFYYVLLFLVFLSLVLFTTYNFSYKEKVNDFRYLKKYNFLKNNPSEEPPIPEKWCTTFYIYNANESLTTQSNVTEKVYCEVYG